MTRRWRKRIWSCPNHRCWVRTWTERSWLASLRRALTNRARVAIMVDAPYTGADVRVEPFPHHHRSGIR